MSWGRYDQKYWEIEKMVSLADAPLARVFRTLIQCEGKVITTFCMEKKLGSSELKYADRYCGVQLIISLPRGSEEEFMELSQCNLIEPAKVGVN